ncbi:hypothetical protein [Phaffia rhodozyma]|uniref:Uncharacterized protein n=1 Tax=Phaffia rhodozyma TaxID=264483 RepID=A0A0F7SJ24_PHARH|nr:hypothetical protein [Phaffia rhodozyma]
MSAPIRVLGPVASRSLAACASLRRLSTVSASASSSSSVPTTTSALIPSNLTPVSSLLSSVKQTVVEVDRLVAKEGPWSARLDHALLRNKSKSVDLEGSSEEMEIAVLSTSLSGGSDVITALLEDPLNTDPVREQILRGRRNGITGPSNQSLQIRHGQKPFVEAEGSLVLDSDFLSLGRFYIREIPSSTSSKQAFSQLLFSTIPILVIDNLRLLSQPSLAPLLPSLLRHPNLRIVVNMISDLDPACHARVFQEIDHFSGGDAHIMETMKSRVVFVAAKRSLRAVDVYRSSTSAETVDVNKIDYFQNESVASNMSALKQDLLELSAKSISLSPSSSPKVDPMLDSTLFLAKSALRSASYELLVLSTHLDAFASAASDLRTLAATTRESFLRDALVLPPKVGEVGHVHPESIAGEVVRKARANVVAALTRFTWARLLLAGKVDDLVWELERAVRDGWGGEGERLLIFQTGKLNQIQTQLDAQTTALLQSPPSPTLLSPVLLNSIPSPALVRPTLLLSPLHSRQAQLLSPTGPLAYFQLRAQRAVLGSYLTSGSAVVGAYLGYLEGLCEVGTGLGFVGLGIGLGIRWGQGKWAKAQKKFWVDWQRVEDGLEADLQAQTSQALDTHVVARPLSAAQEIDALITRKRSLLDEQEKMIEGLLDRRKALLTTDRPAE